MSLQFLDIRAGRANRIEFLILAMGLKFILLTLAIFFQENINSSPIMIFFQSYIIALACAKRLRDINISGLFGLVFTPIIVIFSYVEPVDLLHVVDLTGNSLYENISIPMKIICGLIMVFLLLVPGNSKPNKYGNPPEEFSFKNFLAIKNIS